MKKFKIKKGDEVVVIAGKEKGKKGNVLSVLKEKDRVLVSNVNLVKKHRKPGGENPEGIITQEASLHISNVALTDPLSGKASRVGYKTLSDGKKVRFSKRSQEIIDK